jgi:hypothetical protein
MPHSLASAVNNAQLLRPDRPVNEGMAAEWRYDY